MYNIVKLTSDGSGSISPLYNDVHGFHPLRPEFSNLHVEGAESNKIYIFSCSIPGPGYYNISHASTIYKELLNKEKDTLLLFPSEPGNGLNVAGDFAGYRKSTEGINRCNTLFLEYGCIVENNIAKPVYLYYNKKQFYYKGSMDIIPIENIMLLVSCITHKEHLINLVPDMYMQAIPLAKFRDDFIIKQTIRQFTLNSKHQENINKCLSDYRYNLINDSKNISLPVNAINIKLNNETITIFPM